MNYEKIREYCETRAISLPELAEKIGMTKSGLYQAISKKTLTVEKLEMISEVLNVTVSVFFDKYLENNFKYQVSILQKKSRDLEQKFAHEIHLRQSLHFVVKHWVKAYEMLTSKITKRNEVGKKYLDLIYELSKEAMETERIDKEKFVNRLLEVAQESFDKLGDE